MVLVLAAIKSFISSKTSKVSLHSLTCCCTEKIHRRRSSPACICQPSQVWPQWAHSRSAPRPIRRPPPLRPTRWLRKAHTTWRCMRSRTTTPMQSATWGLVMCDKNGKKEASPPLPSPPPPSNAPKVPTLTKPATGRHCRASRKWRTQMRSSA